MMKSNLRDQVFEVVVRQALANAAWREICDGPMKANGIHPEEVEAEVRRRKVQQVMKGSNVNLVGILAAIVGLVILFLLFR